jgi:hypothetical protein
MNPLFSAWSRYIRLLEKGCGRKSSARARAGRKPKRVVLGVETLEDRTVPTAVAAPTNLVSSWTANNTAADAMGLNNATAYGLTYVAGEVGKAFSFDGVDDRAQIVDNASLQFTTSMSIEGWIKVNGFPAGGHGEILFRGDDRGGLDPYSLSVEANGTLNFQVTDATNAGASVAAPIATGQFIHVAGTLDDATGTMSLYENGALVAQQTTTIRPFQNLDPTSNPSIAIGNHGGYPTSIHNFPFNGLIDELSVYGRALTPGEVFGIYKAGSSGKVISPISVDGPSVLDGSGGATTPVTFTITRTGSLSGSLKVNWTTADDTAIAGADYNAASGTVTFADGQATQTVQVTTIDSNVQKPSADFELIATPVGGTPVMGLATILNDDVPAPSGLVSWWTANGTAADLLGQNNGTLNGTVTFAPAEVGLGFEFNSTSYLSTNTTGFPTGSNDRTMEMWVNVKDFGTGQAHFAGYGNFGTNDQNYGLGALTDHQLFFTQWGQSILGPALQAGQWYHIAVTNVGDSATLYLNGTVVATGSLSINTPANTQLYVGRIPGPGGDGLQKDEIVDEISVYNRALSASEIQSIYQAGSAGKTPPPVVVNSPSVVDGSGGAATPVSFTLERTGSLSGSLTVNWTTADDTAVAGTDYVAASGTVTFADGQAMQTVQVTTLDTNVPKPNIDFKLIATPAGGPSFTGVATILNDDASISVANDTATEGGTAIRPLGAFIPAGLGGLTDAYAIIDGPDGNVYVSTLNGGAVYRYDAAGNPLPAPGQSGAMFVAPGSGGLSGARDIAFGPDGYLYVASGGTSSVLRYDPVTDASAGTFIAAGSGGLEQARGLLFSNGYLYVTSAGTTTTGAGVNSVLRFDATTGAPAGVSGQPGDAVFISGGSGGLTNPSRMVFGPDGRAYVASTASTSNAVLRYDGTTGAFIDTFVPSGSGGLDGPIGMVFRPDGYLYVVGWRSNSVLRYQASNGAFAGIVVPSGSGGLSNPDDLLFAANGNLLVTSKNTNQVLRYGAASQLAFTVSLASPSAGTTTVSYATADGTAVAGRDYVAASGTLTFPPGLTSETVVVQTLDDGVADPTRFFSINLSNPTGGVITSGQGVGTILDDTKFYVVDGGTSDSTYQYAVGGGALGNNALGSGDTAPRGVATTAAGTTEWVVDANKNVYVYNTGGALLGSWSASGLSSSAQINGIATNGTDVWLLDNYTHKVYDYVGAASRLSGSQSAASSFGLATAKKGNAANNNGKGIVTDGTSFWVVDGTALKVFKYTLAGSLLGSWAIDPANAHPTGLTINPSNVSDIWIVDNGTKKVYQYTAAASRTSGSQNAAATFALAPGDTNPQGIADPPVANMLLASATSSLATNQPFALASNAKDSSSEPIVAVLPALSGRDAVFAMLARESLQSTGEPSIGLMAGGSLAPHLGIPVSVASSLLTPAGTIVDQKSDEHFAPLTPGTSLEFRSDRNVGGLMDSAFADEESLVSAAATDSFFAGLMDDATTEE